jgi:hypothetical protein
MLIFNPLCVSPYRKDCRSLDFTELWCFLCHCMDVSTNLVLSVKVDWLSGGNLWSVLIPIKEWCTDQWTLGWNPDFRLQSRRVFLM